MNYYLLGLTSRSFARVIQELTPELKDVVCVFYLVLRGLDTIEDDMTIEVNKKINLLKNFHTYNYQKGIYNIYIYKFIIKYIPLYYIIYL